MKFRVIPPEDPSKIMTGKELVSLANYLRGPKSGQITRTKDARKILNKRGFQIQRISSQTIPVPRFY